jgi:hypothetical protein
MPLKLKWERTWPDRPRDYVARLEDGQSVCRVYFSYGSAFRSDEWSWTCNGRYKGWNGSTSGYAATKNEAARLAEEAWFALIERYNQANGRGTNGDPE